METKHQLTYYQSQVEEEEQKNTPSNDTHDSNQEESKEIQRIRSSSVEEVKRQSTIFEDITVELEFKKKTKKISKVFTDHFDDFFTKTRINESSTYQSGTNIFL